MAYIHPHKRHAKDSKVLSPIPDSLVPRYKKTLNFGSHDHHGAERMKHKHAVPGGKVIYGDQPKFMWFAVGTLDDGQFPSYVHLQPTCVKFDNQNGERLVLVNRNLNAENIAMPKETAPWDFIAERVQADLFSSYHELRKQMICEKNPLVSLGNANISSVIETSLKKLKHSFYTKLPTCTGTVIGGLSLKIGLNFEDEKDIYHVKLSDATRRDSTISCKCRVRREDNKLELYKIQLNQLGHLIVDISCLDKNLDMRLMLCTKRIVTSLSDEEMNSIRALVDASILDPDVKGGLKWPLGEASSGDRYRVVGGWHTIATSYINSSMRLKVRNVDPFDFMASIGGATTEVNLELKGIVSELHKEGEVDLVSDMLKENLKTIWDNFLTCDHSFE